MAHPQPLAESRRDLFRTLAADWNCGYLDVTTEWVDAEVQAGYDPGVLARDAWLPLHLDDDGYVLVAVAAEPTADRVAMIEAAVGAPVCVAVTSDADLADAIRRAYPPPAGSRPTRGRWIGVVAALLVVAAALAVAPGPAAVALAVLTSAGYLGGVGLAVADRLRGTAPEHARKPVALLLTPPMYAVFVAALVLPAERLLPAWALGAVLASPLAGNAALVYADLLDAFRRRGAAGLAFLRPLRWLLDSAAAHGELWRLLTRRDWEKHGNRTVHSGDPAVAAVEPG